MKIHAYKIQKDGSIDLANPIVADINNVPDGYRLVTLEDDLTYGEPLDVEPSEPSEADRLDAIESALLAMLMTGG